MTWMVSIISRGVELCLSDNADYLLTGIDGIGHAAVARISERGPMQHGESDLGYRLQPRRIVLAVEMRGGDRAAWLARRAELIGHLRSSERSLQLRLARDGWMRQIDCYLAGEMMMAPDNLLAPLWQGVGIELVAPDPTWYDPVPTTLQFDGGGGEATTVPTPVPTMVGSSEFMQLRVVGYNGSWEAAPVVRVVGPIQGARIENTSTGEKLDFAGVTIAAGHYYEIDCRYGRTSVVDDAGTNKIADLTADSNLSTFAIRAHPDVLDGKNALRVAGTNISAATLVRLTYYTRYVGV